MCWTPAWLLSENSTVSLKLYEGKRLVEKIYISSLVTTTFVGKPLIVPSGSTTSNAKAEGNAIITIRGNNFAFADVSPRARISPTACMSTLWNSNSQVKCRTPKAEVLTADFSVTVGPYHVGSFTKIFTYDGPVIQGAVRGRYNNVGVTARIALAIALPLTVDEFDTAKQLAYREAIGSIMSTNFSNVIILNVTNYSYASSSGNFSSRRLVSFASMGIKVDTTVVIDEVTVHRLLPVLTVATISAALQNASVLTNFQSVIIPSSPVVTLGVTPEDFAIGNMPSHALGITFVIAGRFFAPSGTVRIGGSACMASLWQSDSTILCRSANAVGQSHGLTVTIERLYPGTRKAVVTYDSPAISALVATNVRTLLRAPLTATGLNFGTSSDYTPRGLVGASAFMFTNWLSDSTIICLTSPVIGSSMRITVTSESNSKGSSTEIISYDRSVVQVSTNIFQAAAKIKGVHLGLWQTSLQSRLGDSAQETSLWVSATSVLSRAVRGISHSRRIVLTVGSTTGSGSKFISYDAPSVHYGHEMIDEGIRIADPFSRSGVGKHINMTCISTRIPGKF